MARFSGALAAMFLALAACTAPGGTGPDSASAPAPAPELVTIPLGDGRSLPMTVDRPARVRGVMLFGHGGGTDPARYDALARAFAGRGWLVLRPTHADSARRADRVPFGTQQGFRARIAELEAAAALGGRLAPGKPMVAAGHSYGSLFAAMRGGALAGMGPPPATPVRAVAAFSSPGRIPGLIGPGSYAGLAVPTLVVTGDADLVPGFVDDWRQHLAAFEDSPAGDKVALVVRGGTHASVADPAGPAFSVVADFLAGHALDDRAARARLDALRATAAMDVRRR